MRVILLFRLLFSIIFSQERKSSIAYRAIASVRNVYQSLIQRQYHPIMNLIQCQLHASLTLISSSSLTPVEMFSR